MSRTLVLASRSPQRRKLLHEAAGRPGGLAGLGVRIEPPRAEEEAPFPGEPSEAFALRLARAKVEEVASRLAGELGEGDLVLGADTVVDLGGEVLGQPSGDEDARRMLSRLSGSRHAVVTAVVVVEPVSGRKAEAAERTELEMLAMTAEEIDAYVATGEGRGKAGGYAIQERGDRYVRVLSGSRTNVVGLPVERVEELVGRLSPSTGARARGPSGARAG